METHYYGTELNVVDPLAAQPEKLRIPLKPHQQAALAKAIKMEREGYVDYDVPPQVTSRTERWRTSYAYRGRMRVRTNIGILGDLVGYGKTLTALGIISATSPHDIRQDTEYIYSSHGRHVAKFTAFCQNPDITPADNFIHSTLVVVPRGPVFVQWLTAIQTQTNLRVLALDSMPTIRRLCPSPEANEEFPRRMKEFFEQYDMVLIKNTTIRNMTDYYSFPFNGVSLISLGWDRIMVDEAHDILKTVPFFDYKFMWLISATYYVLPSTIYATRNYITSSLRDIVTDDNINFLLVKGNIEFVRSSFTVPEMNEVYYICRLPHNLSVVQPFLSSAALERVNATDIAGAIREMGGSTETEDDIVRLVTLDIQKDIRNKEHEIAYISGLEVAEDYKQSRLTMLNTDLKRLQDRLEALRDRVTELSKKTCGICYDNYDNPIILPCTHVFCGSCLMQWMRNNRTCPECRKQVRANQLIAIVDDKDAVASTSNIPTRNTNIMDKVETLINIITNKPNGRFLVFSRIDSTFHHIMLALERAHISYAEIKGSTAVMMRILQRFQDGQLQVILLNTHHAGSGIDISCATDVVIFHQMGTDKVQAVGRAQRVGRTETLNVHNLCYPHEM